MIVSPNKVRIKVSHKPVNISKTEKDKIEEHWSILKQKNKNIFNGKQFSCLSIKQVNKKTVLKFVPLDYKNYLWMLNNNLEIPGLRPSCVDCVFYSISKQTFYFVKRSNKVSTAKNLLSNVGGSIDYSASVKTESSFFKHICRHMIKEILEEVQTKYKFNKSKLQFLGISVNNKKHFINFQYLYLDKIVDINNFENTTVISVQKSNLIKYVKANKESFANKNISYYKQLLKITEGIESNPHYVYIVRCTDNTLYTGYTNNLDKRIALHNSHTSKTKYTKVRQPVKLVYYKKYTSKTFALKQEYKIKQLSKLKKENIVSEFNLL